MASVKKEFNPLLANVLPNGAQIAGRKLLDSGVWVWVAYWEGHAAPYVTWLSNEETPGETYWGHYFEDSMQATKDYLRRINEN